MAAGHSPRRGLELGELEQTILDICSEEPYQVGIAQAVLSVPVAPQHPEPTHFVEQTA